MVNVALVQLRASTEKEQNLERIVGYIEKAADMGAALVAFPEFMMFYTPSSQNARQLARMAERIDGRFVRTIAEAARRYAIQVVGTMYEKGGDGGRVYDTSFFLNQRGELVSQYRKIHLYDAMGFHESRKLAAGSYMPKPIVSRAGRIGMLICYDLRFPEMARSLALAGAHVLVAPSAWVQGEAKEEHWITINRTRAIENGCYVVAPDQVGNIYCGRSLVVDPYGTVLVDMGAKEGVELAEISLERLRRVRKALPLLKGRKPQIYRS